MDRQNSTDYKEHACHAKATLQYASTLKAHIHNQVFELTAALKKAEHVLSMQIDQQCRAKLQGLEYLCNNDKCSAGCQKLNTQFEDDDGFPKKSNLDLEFKLCMKFLQNYGQARRIGYTKITARASDATLVKEKVESRENSNPEEDDELCFEFVDSVECLADELHPEIRNFPKKDGENLPETVDNSEEALERASCSSVDSFDVIPNECCMNDSVCMSTQTLPGIVPLSKLAKTNSSKDGSLGHTTFYLPNLQRKEKKERKGLFNSIFVRSPLDEIAVNKGLPPKVTAEATKQNMCGGIVSSKGILGVVISTSRANTSPAQEVCTNTSVQTTTDVVDDIEVISSTSEANVNAQQADASPEEQSAVSQDENNPANALQDSFKPYLQKQDLKAWVHQNPGPRSNSYEDWVFRAAAPSNPDPLTGLHSGSSEPSDAVGAFFRQLQTFVA